MKKILNIYGQLMKMFLHERKRLIFMCLGTAVIMGMGNALAVYANSEVFNKGMDVARGDLDFSIYTKYLLFFIICAIIPQIGNIVMEACIVPDCKLFYRTVYKGKMLKKLEKLEYWHFENEHSVEIMDKAYGRAEEAAMHLFPSYIFTAITSFICIAGIFVQLAHAAWWLPFSLLLPYVVETYYIYKRNFDIYREMEGYWNQERKYGLLGDLLKEKDSVRENRLNQSSNYLIGTYRRRLHTRNREYERFYFLYLRKITGSKIISKAAQIINAIFLLILFCYGRIDIGQLIAFTMAIFTSLWMGMDGVAEVIKWSGHHINSYDYYDKYFKLSEDREGTIQNVPGTIWIEFRHVSFRYPGTDKNVLNDISFVINHGEKVSIVGENGEGKTTIIKLLLGLYQPDSGEILVSGRILNEYSNKARRKMFGTIFQDFNRYALSLRENVGVGMVEDIDNFPEIKSAMEKAKVDEFVEKLPEKENTMLTRFFTDGIELSGGQWQRIAIARAFMGNRPVLILDEPTSQLDPMAESRLYSEFMEMSKNKTAILITHRLGATMITDRILVISQGCVAQSGTHESLLAQGGIYADMFNCQKQWYKNEE